MPALLQGTGLAGLFSSRAFIPCFLVALALRFGPQMPWVNELGVLSNVDPSAAPGWFTSNISLTVLGILAVMEVAAMKSSDARELLNTIDRYIKPVVAIIAYLGLIGATDAAFIQQVAPVAQAGFLDILPSAFVGGLTYLLASVRAAVWEPLLLADSDDEAGIQRWLSWVEDAWAGLGILALVVFPIIMLVLIGMVMGVMVLLRQRAKRVEEQSKIACPSCSATLYKSALFCPTCRATNPSPTQVNWLGASTGEPVSDIAKHPYRLAERKRCPNCASWLSGRKPDQHCDACDDPLFNEPDFLQNYHRYVAGKLPRVLGVSWLWSLIPVIGAVPGVIYYRLAVVAPFRRYLPRSRQFGTKWGLRGIAFVLLAFQWVPIVGSLSIPLMALLSFTVYRNVFDSALGTRGITAKDNRQTVPIDA
jgi:hypothetical protein